MLNELLAQLWTHVHGIEHTSIRLYESDAISVTESILLKNGLFMLFGLTLEKASAVLDESSLRRMKGGLVSQSAFVLCRKEGFASFLTLLDEVDDIVTTVISSSDSRFKARGLLKELHCCLVGWSPNFWRTVSPLFTRLLDEDEMSVDSVRFFRQWCNLLSKIHISRADLLAESHSEYLYAEFLSFAEASVQSAQTIEYRDLISDIRFVLKDVISAFTMQVPLPKHGPGAVSDSSVKSIVDKYLAIGFDARVNYMLTKGSDEKMDMYSPFPLGATDRTSRVVFVPKTWKKLRGISAEPAGLQFFQQAVLRSIVSAIDKTPLRHVINLRDQGTSRLLALKGSRDGSLATIDLSAASDSVTLRLVKDIFGTSPLCRWLLATRSTHTLLNEQSMEIFKFAPMGSACCFPVECLVFAGVSLAVANRRLGGAKKLSSFRVYGDDIICPAFLANDIMDALVTLGFTVNTDKSYWSGDYRESCGMDAWCGSNVTPLKLKDFSFNFDGSEPLSYEHHSRCISYVNHLYASGYVKLRSFFLKKLLDSTIAMRSQIFDGRTSIVFGDGSRGTCLTCQPDNFHLSISPIKGYQRSGYNVISWKPRYGKLSEATESLLDEVNYFERLLLSRALDADTPVPYDLEYFFSQDSKLEVKSTLGMRMIPSVGVRDEWTPSDLRYESPLYLSVVRNSSRMRVDTST